MYFYFLFITSFSVIKINIQLSCGYFSPVNMTNNLGSDNRKIENETIGLLHFKQMYNKKEILDTLENTRYSKLYKIKYLKKKNFLFDEVSSLKLLKGIFINTDFNTTDFL
jgi:hypothetical protein